jgi:hypothetical protein
MKLPPRFKTAEFFTLVTIISSLLAAIAPLQAQTPWKFMVVGDTRGTSSTDQINTTIVQELATEIVSQNPAFVLVPGDLVYSGTLAAFQGWKELMAPVYQRGIGVYPVIGNHDANDPSSFAQTFGSTLPDNGPSGEVNRTYAIAYDNVLILGLDTYVNVGRVNQPWIDSMLAAHPYPHVFTFGHMPAFKANHTDCLDDYPAQRDAFWNSLRNAGARVYFCGHDHFYDHMRVGDGDGDLNNDVHQLIVGGGGAPLTGGYAYDGANTAWTPAGIYHDMQYGYAVVAVSGLNITITYFHRTGAATYVPTSEVWSYTVPSGPQPPDSPTGLIAVPGNAQVALSWQPSIGALSYDVQRAAGSPSGTFATISAGLAATGFTDTSVVNGTTYYYAVSAVNEAGQSPSSAYVSATPKAPPLAPTSVSATSPKRGQTKVTWTASVGARSYNVKRAATSGGTFVTVGTGIIKTSFTENKLTSRATYYYAVSAVNSSGESLNSTVASVTVK